MKFHEIIPELIAGKRFVCKEWIRESRHIYAVLHDDGSFHLMWSDNDNRVTTVTIGAWVTINSDAWEEYHYPKDLEFVEAYRMAKEDGAIIKTNESCRFFCHGSKSELRTGLGTAFKPNINILDKWHVVGYKGEK